MDGRMDGRTDGRTDKTDGRTMFINPICLKPVRTRLNCFAGIVWTSKKEIFAP